MALTRWDAQLLVRAAGATALALGLAWLVTAATDEGGVSWGERAGRTLPLAPVCAAVGAWVALAAVRARGETRALAALGRSPAQVGAGAVAGASLIALLAAGAVAWAPAVDAAVFYPRAASASPWFWQMESFVNLSQGVLVGASGAPRPLAAERWTAVSAMPRHGRAAAAIAMALAGVGLPLLLTHPLLTGREGRPSRARFAKDKGHRGHRGMPVWLASGAALAASIVLFQAAASGHAPAILGAAPPAVLLVFAFDRYRRSP